jgi:flagellar biogenesis protein FliO
MKPGTLSAAAAVVVMLWPTAAPAQAKARPVAPVSSVRQGPALENPRPADPTTRAAEPEGIPEYQFNGTAVESSLVWDGARMVLSLAVVLVLLGVGVKVMRRWPGLGQRETAAGPLQVLGRLPLTAKEAVCLVRAGGEVLVVGVSPAGVSLLHRLDGGLAEPLRSGGSRTAPVGQQSAPSPGGRWRELAARIRDVQAAWAIGPTDSRIKR